MSSFSLDDFDYKLPRELIAHAPKNPRDSARLLLLNRRNGHINHARFSSLTELLRTDDVLVINDTKVMPSRLCVNKATGRSVELLLLESKQGATWSVLSKPGLRKGNVLLLNQRRIAEVITESDDEGVASIQFLMTNTEVYALMHKHGTMPLPPYIQTDLSQVQLKKKYQTVFALNEGSAAAPTASLHFTHRSLNSLRDKGVNIVPLTLSVGLGTFKFLTANSINQTTLHAEHFQIPTETARALFQAKQQGRRIIAVGTTVTRALESSAESILSKASSSDWQSTTLFIKPGYAFKLVDGLITNFHVPQSSLLMLASAFTSHPNTSKTFTSFDRSMLGKAYTQAIENQYRFFSFGDAMLIE
jgi:S-adenosylmethionine:tRNA ribosyltransferase-isomerase